MRLPLRGLTLSDHVAVVSSPFGPRVHPISGVVKQHNGVDFAVPEGTPLVAVDDGVIERAETGHANGLHVVLRTVGGLRVFYLHMSRLDVVEGQHVRAGEDIGDTGATGAVTGPHLHFEVHRGGTPIDPMTVLAGAAGLVLLVAVVTLAVLA